MSEGGFIFLLFAAAILTLIAELFIPSHGVLTVVALALLIGGIVKTFDYYGETAGGVSIIASLIGLPVFAAVAIRVWPNTRIGRMIAPDNPDYSQLKSDDLATTRSMVGSHGRSLSPLRPVGTCEFNGHRVQCICENGMIESGVSVRAIAVRGRDLIVAPDESASA